MGLRPHRVADPDGGTSGVVAAGWPWPRPVALVDRSTGPSAVDADELPHAYAGTLEGSAIDTTGTADTG